MVHHEGSARRFITAVLLLGAVACSPKPAEAPVEQVKKPADSQHADITTPHGDHSPHHGGMVMMNGDMHYEVVLDRNGKHHVWFSDSVREELPASVASNVVMVVTPKMGADETMKLKIDDSGESWVADGHPLASGDVIKLTYSVKGEPFEVEIPVPD